MSDAAGSVNIVLSVNKANFTAAMQDAQRQLDKFAGKSKSSGHAAVTSVQAVSASLRTLHGGFEQNLRSMERWVAQSKTATMVAKAIFPIVGAATFGVMIGEIGKKVFDFIQTANKMPKAIQQGFASMQLASQSSTDALRLTNDQLANAIAKLEGKPQNNLAIQFDEAAKAADKLAASIESGNNKLNQLLSANHLSGFALLTGHLGTADREGTIKYFGDQANSNAYDLANATRKGDKAGVDRANKALRDTQNAELASLRSDLATRESNAKLPGAFNDSANINIDKGVITEILNQQNQQTEELRNAKLSAQKQSLEDAKASSEAAKKDAHDRVAAMQTALDAMKLQYNMSIKATYDYWELKKSTFLAGSTGYNDIVKKQSELAVQAATQAHEKIQKAIATATRNSAEDATAGPSLINSSARFMQGQAVKTGGEQTQGYNDSNQLAIEQASNEARQKEAQINDAAGKSMSRYAAAVQLANVHAQEFITTQMALQAILDSRIADQNANPSQANARAVTNARIALNNAQVQRGLQITSDANNANPPATSALVGATDALNEFVDASRDAASAMRDIVTNTLSGFNNAVVGSMTGQRGGFKQLGLGITRNIASKGLESAEGSVLGALGFGGGGKLGTKGNPMYVISAGSGGASALTSLIPSGKSSGVAGFFGGLLKSTLPFLADGGPINGPAIVGEAGPELFMPPSSGTIVPNHQLASMTTSVSGGNVSYSIDARGTDPVQTEMRVRSAIVAAHQSSVKQAVQQVHQQSARQPQRSR